MRKVSLKSVAVALAAMSTMTAVHAQTGQSQTASGANGQSAIGSTTNVNVVNTPTVLVGNSSINPIPVAPTARETYQATQNFELTAVPAQTLSFAVPAGKRFVVEQVSVWAYGPTQFLGFGMPDNNNGTIQLPIEMRPLRDGGMYWGAQAEILAVANSLFAVMVGRGSLPVGGYAYGQVVVSGYLVSAS